MITQNSKKLPPDLVLLTEYIIDAAPRSRSVIGEFKYKWLSDGEILKREGFRPDKGIFELYKSMDLKETEKISNPVMRTFWIARPQRHPPRSHPASGLSYSDRKSVV